VPVKVVIVSKLVRGIYQRQLEEVAALDEVELTVISPPSWREGKNIVPLERRFTRGYELVVTPIVFNGHFHVHFYPRLAGLIRKLRPDILHVDEEPYNLATWLALRAGEAIGARRLFYTWQNIYRALPLPFSQIERENYRLADGAIVASSDAEAVLRRKGFDRPIWQIPPGLDFDLYRPAEPAPDSDFVVGYVGRLVPEKGIDLLLRACQTLAPPWRLLLVGDGNGRAALAEQATDLGIAERVSFVGALASTAVPQVLRGLSVLVLPSRSTPRWREQFGRVLVEAMASAVPVVGSDSGEIPNVIGDAGLVFPEDDWEALADRLSQLQQSDSLRRQLAAQGRARALSRYSHRSVAEKTVAVYRSLLRPNVT
jgi:glycosyltransferase involved in cell wall biosynthesis